MAAAAPSAASPPSGISVIIPAYNYAHYLPQAVDSVLRQEYPLFELIVVDDGSTDNTAEVVRRYGESVRYVFQKNAGLSAARNTGIRAARHPLVCFLDADDLLLPGLLRKAGETFARLPETFALVAFHCQFIDRDGNLISTKQLDRRHDEEITTRDIILKTRFCPTGVVARRAAFDDCGFFDTTLRSSEDRDIWIRISSRHRVYLLQDNLVLYRRHAASMSRHSDRMKENMRRVIGKARSDRRVPPTDILFWLRVKSFFHFQTAWMYFDEQRRGAAIRDLAVSLLLWPWFSDPSRLNEPPLFRARSLFRFLLNRRN